MNDRWITRVVVVAALGVVLGIGGYRALEALDLHMLDEVERGQSSRMSGERLGRNMSSEVERLSDDVRQSANLGELQVSVLASLDRMQAHVREHIEDENRRRSEAEVMCRGVHGIRGLFMPAELGPLRRVGLGLVSRSWVAREAFIRRATARNGNAPALARGVGLNRLLHPAAD